VLTNVVANPEDLEVVCTLENQRGRGYGTALLEKGNRMADDMDYILYLDSERDARSLYEKVGYMLNEVEQTSPLVSMMRQKKSKRS